MTAKYSVKTLKPGAIIRQFQIKINGEMTTATQYNDSHTAYAVVDETGKITKSEYLDGKMHDNIFSLKSAASRQAEWMARHS